MEKLHFTILGNHNFGISLYMENLLATYGDAISVDIVALTKKEDNNLGDQSYDVPGIVTKEILYMDWDKPENTVYLNSGMSGKSRRKIYEFFRDKFNVKKEAYGFSTHPSSVVSSTTQLGYGTYVGPNITVGPHTILGDFVFINRNSSVGHHVTLKNYVMISSGCALASQSVIEESVYIGIGANIIEKIKVGANTIIGAGSLVTKDIPRDVVAYGSPAVVIRKNLS